MNVYRLGSALCIIVGSAMLPTLTKMAATRAQGRSNCAQLSTEKTHANVSFARAPNGAP